VKPADAITTTDERIATQRQTVQNLTAKINSDLLTSYYKIPQKG
jgi:hypothetical protein